MVDIGVVPVLPDLDESAVVAVVVAAGAAVDAAVVGNLVVARLQPEARRTVVVVWRRVVHNHREVVHVVAGDEIRWSRHQHPGADARDLVLGDGVVRGVRGDRQAGFMRIGDEEVAHNVVAAADVEGVPVRHTRVLDLRRRPAAVRLVSNPCGRRTGITDLQGSAPD